MCTRGTALMNTGLQASGGNLYAGLYKLVAILADAYFQYIHMYPMWMLAHRILQ